jgi:hypothetical protein
MASLTDNRKLVRIVAFAAKNEPSLKTVNVSTTAPTSKHQAKECVQLTAAQAMAGQHPTVMAAASLTPGLPTVYVNGYTGPL